MPPHLCPHPLHCGFGQEGGVCGREAPPSHSCVETVVVGVSRCEPGWN